VFFFFFFFECVAAYLNNAQHHKKHHTGLKYNYGQYFNMWDKVFGTHRLDKEEDRAERAEGQGDDHQKTT